MADIVRGSALYRQRGMSLINSALWFPLICSPSVIFYSRLRQNPDNATSSWCGESELSIIPLHFLLALSTHFSTLHVYRIVIIESYASLPLRAPYVALSVSFSISLPLLPERA